MNKESILNLTKGQELNELVIKHIFGWKYQQNAPKGFYCKSVGNDKGWWQAPEWKGWACAACNDLPYHYSEDIEKVWEVVEKIQDIYPYWRFSLLGGDRDFNYCFQAQWFGEDDPKNDYGDRHGSAYGKTVSEAICKASLIAHLKLK